MVFVNSYARATAELSKGRPKGQRRKINNNTYLERRDVNTVALKLHDTDIVTYHEDGTVVLDTGGWKTLTTRDRMRTGLPEGFSMRQEKGQWFIVKGDPWDPSAQRWLFVDGMMIKDEEVYGGIRADKEIMKAQMKERRAAKKYARDFIDALRAGDVPAPSGGDCWVCAMKDEKGHHALEDDAAEHMREHMKEGYFVPTIITEAIERFPISAVAHDYLVAHWGAGTEEQRKQILESGWYKDIASKQLEKAVYRYVLQKLGQAS